MKPTIAAIAPVSPAEKAGLKRGDVVESFSLPKPTTKKEANTWDKPVPLDGQVATWPGLFATFVQDLPADGKLRLNLVGGRSVELAPAHSRLVRTRAWP